MKSRWTILIILAATMASGNNRCRAQMLEDAVEQTAIVVIQPDGSCRATNSAVAPRATAERQIRMMERYRNMDEESIAATVPSSDAEKPLFDTELIQKIKDMRDQYAEAYAGGDAKVAVIVTNNSVRTETSWSFNSITELLKDRMAMGQQIVAFANIRFEQDTNAHIHVTFSPQPGLQRYVKSMRSMTKLSGAKSSFKIVFPGKVLSSGFPETDGRTTGFSIDAKKDESLDVLAKMYEAPVEVMAEAGGLKISQALESRVLQRVAFRGGDAGEDLPITEAGPGFAAEAQSITTATLRVFPEGQEYFKRLAQYESQTGTIIGLKLFAPKGRTLQSVNDLRVIKAVDDKGRTIPTMTDGNEVASYSGSASQGNSTFVQLRLELPQPDAQTIDQVDAEAIAVTAGNWKQMTLTNMEADSTNEVDLSEVLPDAKLLITKVSSQNNWHNIQAQVKGPATIRRLDFQNKIPGVEQSGNSFSERSFSTKQGLSIRTIMIQSYSYRTDGETSAGQPVLIVRFPEDIRRERVKFKLSGLDIF